MPIAQDDVMKLVARLAWYYEVNDGHERVRDDALEVPIADLREALRLCRHWGVQPHP